MLRPNSYIDKERIIKIIQEKIDEGYDIIKNTTLENKEIGRIIVDFIRLDETLEQLQQEHNFDEEISNKEIKKALSKNEEVEVNE